MHVHSTFNSAPVSMTRAAAIVLETARATMKPFSYNRLVATIENGQNLFSLQGYTLTADPVVRGRYQITKPDGTVYTVDISVLKDGTITGECDPTCLAFAGLGWCKHCEATVRYVEDALLVVTHALCPAPAADRQNFQIAPAAPAAVPSAPPSDRRYHGPVPSRAALEQYAAATTATAIPTPASKGRGFATREDFNRAVNADFA